MGQRVKRFRQAQRERLRTQAAGQRSECRGRNAEVRVQRSECRGQSAEVTVQRSHCTGSEGRGQRAEAEMQRSEWRGQSPQVTVETSEGPGPARRGSRPTRRRKDWPKISEITWGPYYSESVFLGYSAAGRAEEKGWRMGSQNLCWEVNGKCGEISEIIESSDLLRIKSLTREQLELTLS